MRSLLRPIALYAPDVLRHAHVVALALRRLRAPHEATSTVIARQYLRKTGRPLNLARPRGFAEKLNWLKLAPASDLQRNCADKLRVRDYVRERVGPEILPRLIMATPRLGRIAPATIRERQFVLKTNHSWGGVILCRDRDRFDWIAARRSLAFQLAWNNWHRHREPVYRGIRPAVMVEELLEAPEAGPLADLKIFCFDGVPEFIMRVVDRDDVRTKTMFDLTWGRLPVRRTDAPTDPRDPPAPRELPRMIEIARRLAAPFAFCRVDLYDTRDGVRFSEITFFPNGGFGLFEPEAFERRLGDLLVLPTDGPDARSPLPASEALDIDA